ncbi:hypothetical protein AAZX31_19G139400 [Glycine max]|nr:hypothetical protein GLYMA_19G153151v4 [Glycine max]
MGNRNSSSKSKVHGQVTRAASSEPGYDFDYDPIMGMPVTKFRDEYIGKSKGETPGKLKGTGMYSYQQGNAALDSDETFNSFIRRAKCKIRTVSHIDREQSNVAPATPPVYEANAMDNQNDQFSNFIQSTKKKLRTTSSMRKNGSFNNGY